MMKEDKALQNVDRLLEKVSELIEQSRQYVRKAIDTAMVYTYYAVGYYIVEDEQGGAAHARYGAKTLEMLSVRLTERFGRGWSVEQLKLFRKFYMVYSKELPATKEEKKGATELKMVNGVYPIPMPSFSGVLSTIAMCARSGRSRPSEFCADLTSFLKSSILKVFSIERANQTRESATANEGMSVLNRRSNASPANRKDTNIARESVAAFYALIFLPRFSNLRKWGNRLCQ